MKHFFILLFLISSSCFGQKKYQFDYLIEYQFNSCQDTTSNKNVYYYTNSEDNSYYAQIEDLDSVNFEIKIIEQDQLLMTTNVRKQYLFNAENLVIECKRRSNWSHKNRFKFRVEEYEFTTSADTLINNRSLKNYKLQYTAKRKRKTRSIGSNHYIIKDSTEFHLPILTHATAFEEWKKERNIPNGIFQEKIFYNYKNEIQYKYILKDYQTLDKSITVSDNCMGKL